MRTEVIPAAARHSLLLPGDRVLHVASPRAPTSGEATSASRLLTGLVSFLREAVPAEILEISDGSDAWCVRAIAFLDYVPVHVEARALLHEAGTATPGSEAASLRPLNSVDIVKFHDLVTLAERFLLSLGLEIMGPQGNKTTARHAIVDDISWDSFEEDDSADEIWAERLQPILADALNQRPLALREEAARSLALLSDTASPSCHLAFMEELLKLSDQLEEVLEPCVRFAGNLEGVPLTVAYPLLSAIKVSAFCPEAADILARSHLPSWLGKGDWHGLLAQEVKSILLHLSEVSECFHLDERCRQAPQLEQTLKGSVGKDTMVPTSLSNFSTECTGSTYSSLGSTPGTDWLGNATHDANTEVIDDFMRRWHNARQANNLDSGDGLRRG